MLFINVVWLVAIVPDIGLGSVGCQFSIMIVALTLVLLGCAGFVGPREKALGFLAMSREIVRVTTVPN